MKRLRAPEALAVLIHRLHCTPHENIGAESATSLAMPLGRSEAVLEALVDRFESAPRTQD